MYRLGRLHSRTDCADTTLFAFPLLAFSWIYIDIKE